MYARILLCTPTYVESSIADRFRSEASSDESKGMDGVAGSPKRLIMPHRRLALFSSLVDPLRRWPPVLDSLCLRVPQTDSSVNYCTAFFCF